MEALKKEALRKRRTASRQADAELGERAHMLIWRAGRKQGEVAEQVGIEPTAFGKKLKGKNGWAIQEIIDLADALGTTVAYLVGEVEEEHPRPTPAEEETSQITNWSLATVTELHPRNAHPSAHRHGDAKVTAIHAHR